MNRKTYKGIAVTFAAITCLSSCTDDWDNHYAVNPDGNNPVATISVWDLLAEDEELANFKKVLDSCEYEKVLRSGQTYTIWAPTITEAQAQEWINLYKEEKRKGVKMDENKAILRFVQNHIALFNNQISGIGLDSLAEIEMQNGKKMLYNKATFNNIPVSSQHKNAYNGVIYKLDNDYARFNPNIMEFIELQQTGGDNGLDSLYKFLAKYEEIELDEDASVEGDVIDGKVHYLDSVTYKVNLLLQQWNADFNREDSLFAFLAPNNKAWTETVEKYKEFFMLHDSLEVVRDSLQEYYAKNYMLNTSIFNLRTQPNQPYGEEFDLENADSICSTSYSKATPDYKVFYKPSQEKGIFNGTDRNECSNGLVFVAPEWKIEPERTFMKDIVVEATRYVRAGGEDKQSNLNLRTLPGTKYKLRNNTLLYVFASGNQRNAKVRVDVEIPGEVLSNCPYDIKVVFATPLAGDTAIVDTLERRYVIELNYPETPEKGADLKNISLLPEGQEYIAVQPAVVDTVTLVEDFIFPVSTYGDPINRMHMTFKSFEQRTTEFSKTMAINCIILEPKYTPDFVRKESTTEEEVE